MTKRKTNLTVGFLFVSILGILAHFVYDWTGQNTFMGMLTPVNESTWEHMKLLFFPALLYMPILSHYLKEDYPFILESYAWGILAGSIFIPVFFYSYSGILGFTLMPLDIASFFLATFTTFITTCTLAKSQKTLGKLPFVLLALLAICFILFTYNPPSLGIFIEK